ncbi:hypothetical protein [Streptomyces zagrosensis]|uniref:Uncharacterized protein n=1 Tax=Streptomyces zagrosensis TaxID=1042984 RepID=A0A7W9V1E8_9ACTN|nr:hypothetical protein [Streptomyces zagrosensis]MBB5939213.1 hypothetical protein [Streptomyces zagrosensis]
MIVDTGLRAAVKSARVAADHVLDVRTANDGGASAIVPIRFSGNGTGNDSGKHTVDLKLPVPDLDSLNPDQKKQDATGDVTRPLKTSAAPGLAPKAREQCGPVDKNGYQACLGPAIDQLPQEVETTLKQQQRAAAVAGDDKGGMVDWCASNTSGALATRTVECEAKSLPRDLEAGREAPWHGVLHLDARAEPGWV